MTDYLEDHFNHFVRSEYDLDGILRNTFSRKEGSFENKSETTFIIKTLEECYDNEDDVKEYLIGFIENHISGLGIRLLSAQHYKENLSKEDLQFHWNLSVENMHISYLIDRINALKIWVNAKSDLKLQLLIDSKGNLNIFNIEKEKFVTAIRKFGFFELQKVKSISDDIQYKLVDLITPKDRKPNKEDISYTVAMFDYLGFFNFLEKEHFNYNKRKMQREVSKWLESDKDGRRIRGLINSLSKENKKYNSFKYKKQVIEDYQKII